MGSKTKRRDVSFSIILAFICLTIVGAALVPLLSVKLSPSQTMPEINVYFNMYGNSSRVVEMEATSKLESMLSRTKGVQNIWSTSGNGWGQISVRLDKHADIDATRFEISTIIRQTWPQLPKGTTYPYITQSRSDEKANRPFMTYTVNAPAIPILIQQFTENQIKSRLAQIEGINRIDVRGAMPMEWQLEYNYKQLESLHISIDEIRRAIESFLNKEFLGTASISSADGSKQWIRIALVPETTIEKELDVSKIWVKNSEGRLISLGEIVNVSHLEEQARSYYRINGLNSIYLSIIANENANQLNLSKKIKTTLKELKSAFPPGYEVHLSYDTTDYINRELDKVYFRTGLTLLILLLFVLLIYRSFKYLLLITISLVINMAIAVIFYYLFKLEIQLYSLAGLTISMTLVIDNTIVMSDQIIRRNNMKAFLAIFTATLTTIASLIIIFFMDERIRLNLQDFACVIIVNLAVSLLTALFLVPALITRLKISGKRRMANGKFRLPFAVRRLPFTVHRTPITVYFNRFYAAFCRFTWRFRAIAIILLILAFGLPVFLLPDKVEGEGRWENLYNKTFGSTLYKEKIKPVSDKALGGALRLFVQKVYEGSYMTDREETSLYMTATLPNGATIVQMNNLVQRMESYISQFPEIKQFQTRIENARQANINITFTKESELSSFPYMLKSKLISKSQQLGGGSWGVYGLGDGFSNDVRENAGNYRVQLYGYNYDELYVLAEKFKSNLLENRRIKEVTIGSEFSWYKENYEEYTFRIEKEKLAQANIQPLQLFAALNPMFSQDIQAGQLPGTNGMEQIKLYSKQSKEYDTWSLEHIPGVIGEKEFKLSELASVEKTQSPQQVAKEDQQYRLCLQYEYIGASEQGRKSLDKYIESFRKELPMGYTIENAEYRWNWGKDNNKQYWLLLLIFVIIFFTSSILFNSLKQPFCVIFIIPIAFIGIFLTFYLFRLNFDQGGFASFVLLCGIAVNANIYVLNEYNNIRSARPKTTPMKAYLKAWNAKISPIFLTVVSTILGFVPFMVGKNHEAFWFPLAAGTIGGLVMSLVGMFCFLPLFMGIGKKNRKTAG